MTEPLPAPFQNIPPRRHEPSLLERVLRMATRNGLSRLNFDDLTGVTLEVPELYLPEALRIHDCSFCQHAKSTRQGLLDCMRNKQAVNRLGIRRGKRIVGQCHLGVTDIAQPLLYQGRVLGILYAGSAILEGTEEKAAERIRRYCRRRRLPLQPYLRELRLLPRLGTADLELLRQDLETICAVMAQVLDAVGIPLERYRTEVTRTHLHLSHDTPRVVGAAILFLNKNYKREVQLKDVAASIKCSPHHLCRVFKKHIGCGISSYLMRIRIDHARRLLPVERYSVGEVGFQTGFQSDSHFIKVFRGLVGITPGAFREQILAGKLPPAFHSPHFSVLV